MSEYNIGDIVSLNSHPYFQNLTDVKIAGEPINVIPLMVVVEIYKETRTLFNEETGDRISLKGDGRCKCAWFSLKSNVFSDAWFDFDSLKLVEEKQGLILSKEGFSDLEFKKHSLKDYLNKDVLFTTAFLELKKIKETKLHDKKSDNISSYNSLLNFVSPPMQIIDVKLGDEKSSGKFDSKTGNSKKHQPILFFKCRYYNATADKWTEVLLPSESLKIIYNVKEDLIKINKDRDEKGFYIYDYTLEGTKYNSERNESLTILEIDDITYLNGFYSLKTYDLIHQQWKILDIPFDNIRDVKSINEIFLKESYPNFDFKKGAKAPDADKLLGEFTEFISKYEGKGNYILIKYINNSDKIIQRVLKDYFIVQGGTKKASTYLHGYCCKKREMRSFNFNNLKNVKVLKALTANDKDAEDVTEDV